MMKKLILGAGMLASLAVLAADVVPATAAQANKKSQGLQCQQQATAQKLEGAAKKQFMVNCMKTPAPVAPVAPAQ
jgi:opacity protein-like surface antigen